MDLPRSWHYKLHGEWGAKFFLEDGRTIAMFLNKGRAFTDDTKDFYFIGCDSLFSHKNSGLARGRTKTIVIRPISELVLT
jgi:hypothetical protein